MPPSLWCCVPFLSRTSPRGTRTRRKLLALAALVVMLCTMSSLSALSPRSALERLALPRRRAGRSRGFATSSSYRNGTTEDERPPPMPTLDPLVVCGPSGVGKGTIIDKYMTERGGSERFQFTISHTTRQPREGEVDGLHYHFVTAEAMRDLLGGGSFVESARVHGNYYGTSWSALRAVQSAGKRSLLDIDVQGVQRIKQIASETGFGSRPLQADRQEASSTPPSLSSSTLSYLSCLSSPGPTPSTSPSFTHLSFQLRPKYLFIAPPSLETLEARLWGRKSESAESFRRRIDSARSELEYGLASGNFDAVIVNDDLDAAVRDFEHAVRLLYGDGENDGSS